MNCRVRRDDSTIAASMVLSGACLGRVLTLPVSIGEKYTIPSPCFCYYVDSAGENVYYYEGGPMSKCAGPRTWFLVRAVHSALISTEIWQEHPTTEENP